MKEADLEERIRAAFEERQLPRQPFVLDSHEGREIAGLLDGVDRSSITRTWVEGLRFDPGTWLSFMTNEGRIYYLPVLMSLCVRDQESYRIPEFVLSCFFPWPYLSAPHTWKRAVQSVGKYPEAVKNACVRVAARALIEPGALLESGKAELIGSLTRREKHAVKLFVGFLPSLIPVDPLLAYGVEEVLDERIEVGDGYSWLPDHEIDAVVDFIDFLVDECRTMLSELEVGSLLVQRSSPKFWRGA